MKNLHLIILLLISSLSVKAQMTDVQLGQEADTIQNETVTRANTATRIGRMFNNLVDNKANKVSPTLTGTVVLPSTTSIGTVTSTELGFIDGVTSALQTQIDAKMTNPMTTAGDIIYGGASGTPTRLAAGATSGHVLTSNGSGVAPSWQAPSGGGGGTWGSITGTLSSQSDLNTALGLKAALASPTFTGTPTLPTGTIATTQSAGNSTTAIATTAFVTTADNLKADLASPTFTGTPAAPTAAGTTSTTQIATTAFVKTASPKEYGVACSDLTSVLTTGTGKAYLRVPRALTVTAVRAQLFTGQTSGSIITIDINEAGSTILSTKLTIDNSEKTSTTAATAAVISDTALADDAEITVDIDVVGTGGFGLIVWIIGY